MCDAAFCRSTSTIHQLGKLIIPCVTEVKLVNDWKHSVFQYFETHSRHVSENRGPIQHLHPRYGLNSYQFSTCPGALYKKILQKYSPDHMWSDIWINTLRIFWTVYQTIWHYWQKYILHHAFIESFIKGFSVHKVFNIFRCFNVLTLSKITRGTSRQHWLFLLHFHSRSKLNVFIVC